MKSRFLAVTGLLAVPVALIFLSASKAMACEDGDGNKKYVLYECICVDENGNEVIYGYYNDCESGNKHCTRTPCPAPM
jgi:hypothetical protein